MVKVDEDKNSIEVYRNIEGAKNAIQKATGVRKTRAGHILIELSKKTPANEVAERLKLAITQEIEIAPLLNTVILEIKNIDPLITKEEQAEDIHKEMNIQDVKWITIKSLRKHKESKIPKMLSASDHTYILHDFKTIKTRHNADNF